MSSEYQVRDPAFAARVRDSFARQGFMRYLGAELAHVAPGECEIVLPYREELSQQHGFFHGGVIATLADNAGGYAGFSLMAASDSVLTVEFKVNILAPGHGERLLARAHVKRAGRTLTVAQTDILVLRDGRETLCATALQTLMRLADRSDGPVG
ncbi:MAG TPA: PaaI family thioesterase [Gammaproteobacteria bacterium]